ncbi:MAG: thioredoxin domain-containing protein [Pirellulales bacterium]
MDKEVGGLRWLLFGLAGLLLILASRDKLSKWWPDIANDSNLAEELNDEDRPVLVKFGADWCGPCRKMEPILDAFEKAAAGNVKVVRVNIDYQRDLARQYGVSGIPHTILFYKGRVINQKVGYMDENVLGNWVTGNLVGAGLLKPKTIENTTEPDKVSRQIPVSTR